MTYLCDNTTMLVTMVHLLTLEEGQRAVCQLHDNTIQNLHHGGNVQQNQNDWLKKLGEKKLCNHVIIRIKMFQITS